MWDIWETWDEQEPRRRKCQFCKQDRACRHGLDPFLYLFLGETEMVWLCLDCYDLRKDGGHLSEEELADLPEQRLDWETP